MVLNEKDAILYVFGNISDDVATYNLITNQWELFGFS